MSVASPHDGAVFYSDDEGKNRIAAEAYAKRCGQAGKKTTTLEATPCGKWLESENLYATRLSLFADDIWALASVKYAGEASGSCRCFIANAPAERVFRKHELAALLANDKVTDLNNIPRQTLKAIHEQSPDAAFSAVEQADLALRAASPASAAGTAAGASRTASASSSSASSSSAGGGGLPAARISDFHVCPMVTGVVPHVGGPIALGCPTVLIGGLPAARVWDMVVCVGPPDVIAKGSSKVFIGGMPAARLSDSTAHGGKIVLGAFTTLIG
jgi:uncharacterized Zn-binding protein involved in type VI secretion